ncbi:MAG: GlsB/YeaQ/YmgE family stress response membrane protein [Mastigocladus sp. ERB_26_2]|uniref:GlsB/YeaQ/YmgE family stress response membrane protein n=1 Tax=Fischerella muscicola CCMEE 5323 TaxID=2019572 RepID=A0A2N6K7E9_FISMU|nr:MULTISPECIES: GlsB/YeaQ/YmgE family stress response membrane protein [Fischerella]MBD2434402.1 GlsB/YeaQ/YmgE family stress response membrane protein [Fischerella sp. FACHB-380]PLZ93211.1 GlsB/YeaQ/YmgE family stress response membrane protein [Fischerella muscicola CCMEE 5323]
MNLLAWIVLGLLAGAIAKAIYPGYQGGGILATMLLGIVGAVIGGTLVNLLQTGTLAITTASFSLAGLFVAVIGAIIAIFLYYQFTRRAY